MKKYQVLDYAKLLGMEGFSDTLLKNHFTLYQGYVNNTNKVMEALENMLKDGKQGEYEFAELKRRWGGNGTACACMNSILRIWGGAATLPRPPRS